jgi:hypothetical protein
MLGRARRLIRFAENEKDDVPEGELEAKPEAPATEENA